MARINRWSPKNANRHLLSICYFIVLSPHYILPALFHAHLFHTSQRNYRSTRDEMIQKIMLMYHSILVLIQCTYFKPSHFQNVLPIVRRKDIHKRKDDVSEPEASCCVWVTNSWSSAYRYSWTSVGNQIIFNRVTSNVEQFASSTISSSRFKILFRPILIFCMLTDRFFPSRFPRCYLRTFLHRSMR